MTSANGSDRGTLFGGRSPSADKTLFLKLKPICVDILSCVRPGAGRRDELVSFLSKLRQTLAEVIQPTTLSDPLEPCSTSVSGDRRILSLSLLQYAFFPISQLFQANPKGPADLPDRIKQEAFACLHLLVEQWWNHWTSIGKEAPSQSAGDQAQLWRQFLILGAVTLSGSPPTDSSRPKDAASRTSQGGQNSQETNFAALGLVYALLVPRRILNEERRNGSAASSAAWEWDGESELPSLDTLDEFESPEGSEALGGPRTLFPTQELYALTSTRPFQAPLLHILTASLDILASAEPHSSTIDLRNQAVQVVRVLVTCWIPETGRGWQAKILSILPGVVSKMIRVLTSTPTGSASRAASASQTSGILAARALSLMSEVISPVLNDEYAAALRRDDTTAPSTSQTAASSSLRSLEEMVASVQLEAKDGLADAVEAPGPRPSSQGEQTKALLLTMSNLRKALLALNGGDQGEGSFDSNISGDTSESIAFHSHPVAQQSVVHFVNVMLSQCAQTLFWFAARIREEEVVGPPLSDLLLCWLLDIDASPRVSDKTSSMARHVLQKLAAVQDPELVMNAQRQLLQSLDKLPAAVTSHHGASAARIARRVVALLRTTFFTAKARMTSAGRTSLLLPAKSDWERWMSKVVAKVRVRSPKTDAGESPSLPAADITNLDRHESQDVSQMLRSVGSALAEHALSVTGSVHKDNAQASMLRDVIFLFLDRYRYLSRLFTASDLPRDQSLLTLEMATTALYIAREIICGASKSLQAAKLDTVAGSEGKRARQQVRRLAEELVNEVIGGFEEDASALLEVASTRALRGVSDSDHQQLILNSQSSKDQMGRFHGLPAAVSRDAATTTPEGYGPALNLAFVAASAVGSRDDPSSSRGLTARAFQQGISEQRQFQQALQLDILALSATMQGSAFRRHLLSTLYPTVSALTHRSSTIANAAMRSFQVISEAVGYIDLRDCIQENVDYLLGEASWRLISNLGRELEARTLSASHEQRVLALQQTSNGMASAYSGDLLQMLRRTADTAPVLSATRPPQVLIEVIRLLGPASLHLIEDSIDEVLDALDRFHGYEDTCDSLLGVLDCLLETMRQGAASQVDEREHDEDISSPSSKHKLPTEDEQVASLDTWLSKRRHPNADEEDLYSIFEQVEKKKEASDGDADASPTAPPTAAQRSEQLLASILSKSIPFLSHSSVTIRARVLRLFAAGTELLAPKRQDELLPLINQAWPLICARLGWSMSRPLSRCKSQLDLAEQDLFVQLQAMKLIQTFAEHVPDFVEKRLVDDAWPRMRLLITLEDQGRSEPTKRGPAAAPTLLLNQRPTTSSAHPGDVNVSPSRSAQVVKSQGTLQALEPFSSLYKLLLATGQALTPLLISQGPSISDTTLWELLTLPALLRCLDVRQAAELRETTIRLFQASRHCDSLGTAWSVLKLLSPGDGPKAYKWTLLSQNLAGGNSRGVLDVDRSAREILSPSTLPRS